MVIVKIITNRNEKKNVCSVCGTNKSVKYKDEDGKCVCNKCYFEVVMNKENRKG